MITINYNGRLGNIFFVSIGASILAKKYNLKVMNYTTPGPIASRAGRVDEPWLLTNNIINTLGLQYYSGEKTITDRIIEIHDGNFVDCLNNPSKYANMGFVINEAHFQHGDFVRNYKAEILEHFANTKYTSVDKDSLLVNVRIGDMVNDLGKYVPRLDYYVNCIDKISFKEGYIITDSINHPIAQTLVQKYSLKYFSSSAPTPGVAAAEQIMFAKDFNNLVLSSGTFAWWIALLSKANNIYYAQTPVQWTGDIHVYPEWKGISFS